MQDLSKSNSEPRSSDAMMRARNAANFPVTHKILRFVFRLVWFVFARWTPPRFAPWRNIILRLFGAKIHPKASVRAGAKIWYPPNLEMAAYSVLADGVECYNMAHITLGEGAIVSQRAFLCGGTHDYSRASNPLLTQTINIGPRAWICAEAFVGPGCQVPEGCVIGARAVVFGALEPWTVYAGNPAKKVKKRPFDPDL